MAGLPQVGDQVAHFTLTGRIAKGGMSTVYRARDEQLGRDVALKVLSAELSDDGLFRERFERESRLAASISHPNILPIFDAGTWQGYLYISMLLVEGPDVAQLLEAGPLDPARANSIVVQVAAALDAAHAKGLVHRDVKPGNILLLEGAGPHGADHAYLADFGLTRHAASTTRLTRPDLVLGTVGYIAPELLLGHAVDARADQYSLACVTYEMLAGEPPFPRATDVVTIAAHLHEPPPSITGRRPELPSALDGIIARGMAKSPDDRFASTSAFAAAVQAGLRASGVMPLPVGAAAPPDLAAAHRRTVAFERPSRGRSRPIAALAMAVALVLALGAAVVLSDQGGSSAPTPGGPSGIAGSSTPSSTLTPSGTSTATVSVPSSAGSDSPSIDPSTDPSSTPRPTRSPRPTPRPTPNPTPGPTPTPSPTPVPTPFDGVGYVTETAPIDGTHFEPGDTYVKSWTIRNTGTTTWNGTYHAKRVDGVFGPLTVELTGTVAPGAETDLTGSFTVPSSGGTHRATYRMDGPTGRFGLFMWTEIVVDAVPPTPTPSDGLTYVSETPPLDDTHFAAGTTFAKTWTVRNSGTTTWDVGYWAKRVEGTYGPARIDLTGNVGPDGQTDLTGTFTAPPTVGTHRVKYRMHGPNGNFGTVLIVQIIVDEPPAIRTGWV